MTKKFRIDFYTGADGTGWIQRIYLECGTEQDARARARKIAATLPDCKAYEVMGIVS